MIGIRSDAVRGDAWNKNESPLATATPRPPGLPEIDFHQWGITDEGSALEWWMIVDIGWYDQDILSTIFSIVLDGWVKKFFNVKGGLYGLTLRKVRFEDIPHSFPIFALYVATRRTKETISLNDGSEIKLNFPFSGFPLLDMNLPDLKVVDSKLFIAGHDWFDDYIEWDRATDGKFYYWRFLVMELIPLLIVFYLLFKASGTQLKQAGLYILHILGMIRSNEYKNEVLARLNIIGTDVTDIKSLLDGIVFPSLDNEEIDKTADTVDLIWQAVKRLRNTDNSVLVGKLDKLAEALQILGWI